MGGRQHHRRSGVLAAALLLSLGLGSIHAFSVLLEPLEQSLAASRADIAPAYAIGLASLTLAVLLGHRLFRLIAPPILALVTCLAASFGLVIAAYAPSVTLLWLGYGLLFGFANGVGYGYALYVTNLAFERHRGLAMGSVTAIYAVGASGFAALLDGWIACTGVEGALIGLAAMLAAIGVIAGAALRWSGFGRDDSGGPAPKANAETLLNRRPLLLCWLIYGMGVAAGLMAMGHAAGIVRASAGSAQGGVTGVIAITLANAFGGFLAGYLADRSPARNLLAIFGMTSTAALLLLTIVETPLMAIALLAVIGFTYGATIALFPIVTALIFGRDAYARAYGKIFTSWGLAGLCAPWFAGVLYSQTGGYGAALVIAALLAIASGGLSLLLSAADNGE